MYYQVNWIFPCVYISCIVGAHSLQRVDFGNDIQSVVRQLIEKMEHQEATLKQQDAILKHQDATLKQQDATLKQQDATLKQQDATLKKYEGEIGRLRKGQLEEKKQLTSIGARISKDEKKVVEIEDAFQEIGKKQAKQIDDLRKLKDEITKDTAAIRRNDAEIKNFNEELDHIVFDGKMLHINNKLNDSRLQQTERFSTTQKSDGTLTTTTSNNKSDESKWIMKLDENYYSSQCYRIHNYKYKDHRITLWRAVKLGMFLGPDYPDQLWRLQYHGEGYYYINSCYYPGFLIHLQADGKVIARKGTVEDSDLWKLASAMIH